jgi:hypothetical protein
MRARKYRPRHTGSVSVALGKLLHLSPSHAERKLADARKVTDLVVEASRDAGKPGFVGEYFAASDAQRAIEGPPLHCDAHFACLVNRDLLAESESITHFVASETPERRAEMLRRGLKLLGEVSELIAACKAAR